MKQLFYITLLLTSLTSLAQNKFIEVEVSDTITLQPKSFEYVVMIGDSHPDAEWEINKDYDEEASYNRIIKNQDVIEKLLKKHKYNYGLSNSITNYPPLSAKDLTSITVNISSKQELINLRALIVNYDFTHGTISSVQYGDEEKQEGLLLKKLIEKAKSKADLLAKYSELKLGKIIEVKEGKELDGLAVNVHDTYFVSDPKNFSDKTLTGSLHKTLTVRFAAE